MRKKYLSALLFGALLFASAGTFTSCKDYDDDIDGLRTEITDLKSAIEELQQKIGDGKFVTNVAANGQGLTITWNDGSSTIIENVINEATGETEAGDVITFDETTGEILINGEGTGYYASKSEIGEYKAPYVNADGALVLINEKGEEVVTNILTAPVTAITNADGSVTLTIRANGSSQQVIVPSAASAISEIEFLDKNYQVVQISNPIRLLYWDAEATTEWNGPRGNIAQNTTTYSTDITNGNILYTRIAPASIDASQIEFGLIDTKDNLASIKLAAEKYDGMLTRAASNGLYEITVVPGSFADGGDASKLANEFLYSGQAKAMALKPATANYKSLPNVKVTSFRQTTVDLGKIDFTNITKYTSKNDVASIGDAPASPTAPALYEVKVGETVYVSVDNEHNLYDMYLSASAEDVELFGLVFSEDGRTFKATKSPDNVTDATIDLIVHTLANAGGDGNIEETTIRVEINRTLGEAVYAKQTQMPTKVDYKFLVSADKLKESLGDDLNAWYASVNATANVLEGIYADEACTQNVVTAGSISANQLEVYMAENMDKDVTDANIATKLNSLRFELDIDDAPTPKPLKIGTTYYAKLSFKDKTTNKELNNVVVPFELTKPELSAILVKESGVFRDGDNLAYAYMYWQDAYRDAAKKTGLIGDSDGNALSRYYIDRAFTDLYDKLDDAHMTLGTGFTFELEANTNVEGTDKKTNYFAKQIDQSAQFGSQARDFIELIVDTDGDGKDDYAGYKKDLIVNFTGHYLSVNDDSYKYTDTYKFRVMSPILEGEAIAANNMVEVSATGRTRIYKEDIWAKTYNNDVKYDIFKKDNAGNWYRDDIKDVTFSTGNRNVFQMTVATPTATVSEPTEKDFVDSYIEVEGVTENTAKLNVAIEDIWGYTLEDQVDIKTTLNLGE